jgi:hypothetical protein
VRLTVSKIEWIQVVPWAIALVGLWGAHLFTEARERRKEFRSLLDKLSDRLSKLEADGRKFHTAANYEEPLARSIDAEISRIERIVARVAAGVLNAEIIKHKQALTLQNFDRDRFQQHPIDSDLVAAIEATTIDYEEALEREYRLRYPATFPFFRLVPMRESGLGNLIAAAWVGALLGGTIVFLLTR